MNKILLICLTLIAFYFNKHDDDSAMNDTPIVDSKTFDIAEAKEITSGNVGYVIAPNEIVSVTIDGEKYYLFIEKLAPYKLPDPIVYNDIPFTFNLSIDGTKKLHNIMLERSPFSESYSPSGEKMIEINGKTLLLKVDGANQRIENGHLHFDTIHFNIK